jgi:hypothetical protein
MDIPFVKKSVVIVGSWKKSSDPSKTNDFVLTSKPTPPIGTASKPPVKSVHVSPLEKEFRWVASNLNTSPDVALALALATPVAAEFFALTLKAEEVALLRPVTSAEVLDEVPSANVVHEPPLSLYSTM